MLCGRGCRNTTSRRVDRCGLLLISPRQINLNKRASHVIANTRIGLNSCNEDTLRQIYCLWMWCGSVRRTEFMQLRQKQRSISAASQSYGNCLRLFFFFCQRCCCCQCILFVCTYYVYWWKCGGGRKTSIKCNLYVREFLIWKLKISCLYLCIHKTTQIHFNSFSSDGSSILSIM